MKNGTVCACLSALAQRCGLHFYLAYLSLREGRSLNKTGNKGKPGTRSVMPGESTPEVQPREGTVAQTICSLDLLLLTTFLSGCNGSFLYFLTFKFLLKAGVVVGWTSRRCFSCSSYILVTVSFIDENSLSFLWGLATKQSSTVICGISKGPRWSVEEVGTFQQRSSTCFEQSFDSEESRGVG